MMSMSTLDPIKKYKSDIRVIAEILLSEYRTKMFLAVKKKTKPDGNVYLSGYKLAKIASVSPSTAYKWMKKLVDYGIFEYPEIDDVKRVKITEYGISIYNKLRLVFPQIDFLLRF